MRGELTIDDEPPPDDDADEIHQLLAQAGVRPEGELRIERSQREPFYLWPEHWPVLIVWNAVQTCWDVGMNGATGLKKHDVRVLIGAHGHRGRRADQMLLDLLVMERAAMSEWAKQRKKNGKQP